MLQRWHNNIIPPKYHFVAEKNSWFDTGVIQINVMLQARIVYYIYRKLSEIGARSKKRTVWLKFRHKVKMELELYFKRNIHSKNN